MTDKLKMVMTLMLVLTTGTWELLERPWRVVLSFLGSCSARLVWDDHPPGDYFCDYYHDYYIIIMIIYDYNY